MTRVAILTPDPEDESYSGRWSEVFSRMERALAPEGVQAHGVSWSHARGLVEHDLVLPLTVWGYHRAGLRWRECVNAWDRAGARLRNPASVLQWNADKQYLGVLAAKGAPVVPTVFVANATREAMEAACRSFGAERLVVKPQVSASAYRTLRWRPGDRLDGGPQGAAMIQPYLPAIESEGEVSLFYFRGDYSHAVRKVPQPGDFRVQPEYQGNITPHTPSPEEQATAEAILAAIDEPLLYARIDLVRDLGGAPVLIEAELIEPDLYLAYAPDEGAAFARAVAAEARA